MANVHKIDFLQRIFRTLSYCVTFSRTRLGFRILIDNCHSAFRLSALILL